VVTAWRQRSWALVLCLAAAPVGTAAAAPGPLASERLVWPGPVQALVARLASEDVGVRRKAAADLERLPASVQRRLLPELFTDPDPEVRLAVADAALAVRLPDAGARVAKWLSDPDARVREAAAEVLAVFRDTASVAGLGRALEDSEASVRAAAALALGNARTPDAASFLLGHLDDADPEVRHAVIAALEDLGDERAVVPLIGRIQEQRAALRRQAADALGALGDTRAVGALIVALADADAGVRAAAALSLGKLRAADAVWSLSALLERESDPEVQGAVLDALGMIGTPSSVDAALRALSLPRPMRDRIERALARAGDVALPALERCVFQPSDGGAAEVCVGALGRIGGKRASELCERALRQGAVNVADALTALGDAGESSALPTVLEFLTSRAPSERRAAIDAAGLLLDPSRDSGLAVEPLTQALERAEGSRLERAALLGLLGRTGSPRAAPSLTAAANASDEYLRVVALTALGEIGPSGADAVLLAALAGGSFPMRYSAALALRRVGSHASIAPLLDRLNEAPPSQREALVIALAGPIRDAASDADFARLVELIKAGPGPVTDAAIEALAHVPDARGTALLESLVPLLGKLGRAKLAEAFASHSGARKPLLALLDDADPAVRANAAWSLAQVGTPGDIERLAALREDVDVAVAANAVAAVGRIAAENAVDVGVVLCGALEDPRAYVLVNALVGLAGTGAACDKPDSVAWLLEHHPSDEVRLAAARLIGQRWASVLPGALARCAAKDMIGRVATRCASPLPVLASGADAVSDVGVLVVPTGEDEPAPRAPFSLVRADGFIRSGTSDRRGSIWEASAPRGPLRLTLPAVFSD
jgi:HEAT repeat protein